MEGFGREKGADFRSKQAILGQKEKK